MPGETARQAKFRVASRVSQRVALATAFTLLGSQGLHTAIANGDTRSISMHHTHRGDDITVTFKRNGRYDEEGLKKLNHFLRDWRTDEVTSMDPQLFDAVWEVLREFGPDKQIHIISSYRSPRTNAMLRKRSGGVARHSLHMQGKAMDFFVPGVPLDKVREAGLRVQRGGVGFYPTSGSPFVHIDVGNVRHWPRMTREQLVRVFPTGRTVHLPTDGKPLAQFELAQADIAKRASSPSSFEAARIAAAESTTQKPNIFARMFGAGSKADDDYDSETAAPAAAPSRVAAAAARGRETVVAALDTVKKRALTIPVASAVPMPKSRPATAQAAAQPDIAAAPAVRPALAAITPNDIVAARGYWRGLPESPHDTVVAGSPIALASADAATGSIGPFAAPPGYGEGKPREMTLAFAGASTPEPAAQRARPVGAPMPRTAAVAANTTVAAKARPDAASEVRSAPALAEERRESDRRRWEGPWMRALMLTPSVERFMNTTLYGLQDYRALAPLLHKPEDVLTIAFAAEPQPRLSHRRFHGRAVEFVATTATTPRTAALR